MLLGLDIGTSACKTTLFDPEKRCVIGGIRVPLEFLMPAPDRSEVDAEALWRKIISLLKSLSKRYPEACAHLKGMGISVFYPTLLPLGEHGEALRQPCGPVPPEGGPEQEGRAQEQQVFRPPAPARPEVAHAPEPHEAHEEQQKGGEQQRRPGGHGTPKLRILHIAAPPPSALQIAHSELKYFSRRHGPCQTESNFCRPCALY